MYLSFVMNNISLSKNQTTFFLNSGKNDIFALTIKYLFGRKQVRPDLYQGCLFHIYYYYY